MARFAFCKNVDDLDFDSEVPVKPDENGQFPVPIPGKWDELEVETDRKNTDTKRKRKKAEG